MAAFIPSRKDHAANEIAFAKVREDKIREANDGFDGTWVAHPDLVPVAMEVFDRFLGSRPNQVDRQREDVQAAAKKRRDVRAPGGTVTVPGISPNAGAASQCHVSSSRRG